MHYTIIYIYIYIYIYNLYIYIHRAQLVQHPVLLYYFLDVNIQNDMVTLHLVKKCQGTSFFFSITSFACALLENIALGVGS